MVFARSSDFVVALENKVNPCPKPVDDPAKPGQTRQIRRAASRRIDQNEIAVVERLDESPEGGRVRTGISRNTQQFSVTGELFLAADTQRIS